MLNECKNILEQLTERYPALNSSFDEIWQAFLIIKECYESGGKLLICGNGGSCADSQHIVGELMKCFTLKRKALKKDRQKLKELFDDEGDFIADRLEKGLPAIAIDSMPVIATAFNNDVDPIMTYAQLTYNYGCEKDVLLGISTSGNSANINYAFKVAKAIGVKSIGLTGANGGKFNENCDYVIHTPADITHEIQEYHLPIYHALCIMIETYFFSNID